MEEDNLPIPEDASELEFLEQEAKEKIFIESEDLPINDNNNFLGIYAPYILFTGLFLWDRTGSALNGALFNVLLACRNPSILGS